MTSNSLSQKILITGSSGFIGEALLSVLLEKKYSLVTVVRQRKHNYSSKITQYKIGNLDADTIWTHIVPNIDIVIHLAGRAHILNDNALDPLLEFHKVNVEGTLNLARQAASRGVKRFIFISSIGVNGNQTTVPFTAEDEPRPAEPYALSKLEAEIGLTKISTETGMEIVIIRPPLVYGPKAPGNFSKLINIVASGVPLPFGAINNQRSFVSIYNLIDLISTCITHPSARNQTFLVSDDEDISTTILLQQIAKALNKPSRLISIPATLLTLSGRLLGKKDTIQRLCGSLQVDISKTKRLLGWKPPITLEKTLIKTAQAYLNEKTL